MVTKFMVFVNEFNPNSDESVSYDIRFASRREAISYVRSLNKRLCSGTIEKWFKKENEPYFTNEIIDRF